jgi:SsrA-binding protein
MAKKQANKGDNSGHKVIATNKRARFDYHIIEAFEAGIVLTGPEIKSVRQGDVSLAQSFVSSMGDELFLVGAHINPYSFDNTKEYDPVRKRKLLLNRSEIDKISARVATKGYTCVALQIYLKNGRAKLEVALAKGKNAPDKRDSIKERESKREMDRAKKLR